MGLFADIPEKIMAAIRGKQESAAPQYSYDPNTQQYTAMKKGGKVSSASKRADGIAQKGKTKGKFV